MANLVKDEHKLDEQLEKDFELLDYPQFDMLAAFHRLKEREAATFTEDKAVVMKAVERHDMAPFYEYICSILDWKRDEALYKRLQEKNTAVFKILEDAIKDAEVNEGESELREALTRKAMYYNRIGDKDKAIEAYEVAYKKTIGMGGKMNIMLTILRICLFFGDFAEFKKHFEKAKSHEKEWDWERKNKLKVYRGIQHVIFRDFKAASDELLSVVATFTADELMSFKSFAFYTVLTAMVAQDRHVLRTKVIESPEIFAVIHEIPHLSEFLSSYQNGKYAEFMRRFVDILDVIQKDPYMDKHVRYFARAMRLNAYRQFLQSYESVTMDAMATAFGIDTDFLDVELSSFISSGKLNCKIDKVSGVIEANQEDKRNVLYKEIIQQGDLLLNRMQKLSKVTDM